MESLALAAAVVMLVIIACGAICAIAVLRPPTALAWKILVSPFAAGSIALGQWLARLDVGMGARVIGVIALVAGLGAIWRSWFQTRPV